MANYKTGQTTQIEKDLEQQKQNYASMQRKLQFYHNHRDNNGTTVESLSDSSRFIRNRELYPDTALYCKKCGSIFDKGQMTDEDINRATYVFNTMFEQLKMLGNYSNEDYDRLVDCFQAFSQAVGTATDAYTELKKHFNGDNNNKNKNRGKSKGAIRIQSGYNN